MLFLSLLRKHTTRTANLMLFTMSSSTGAKREVLAYSEVYRVSAGTEVPSTLVAYNSLRAEGDNKMLFDSLFTHHRVAD